MTGIKVVICFAFCLVGMSLAKPNPTLSFSDYQLSTSYSIFPCEKPGWFPNEFGLKDHSLFWHEGFYYLVSIYLPGETRFAYGRSPDLCTWEELTPVLSEREPGTWDEYRIWAPYVYSEAGTYYLYYTGVTNEFTQSILLASTNHPDDPHSWQIQEMIFQPNHTGMVWQAGAWADCRDPQVIKMGDLYYLIYTAADVQGGIIGIATSLSPGGPWLDWGAIYGPLPENMPESPALYFHDGYFYLFFHPSGASEQYLLGPTIAGPWSGPYFLFPGWAHEVWQGQDAETYTSYLTDYTITIASITWNSFFYPPRPVIGNQSYQFALPMIQR